MAITISRADYDDLWQERDFVPKLFPNPSYFEEIKWLTGRIGQGHIQSIELRGITLCLLNYQLQEDLVVQEEPSSELVWELGFNLSGNRSGKRTGENFLTWGREEQEWTWTTEAKDPVIKVDIHLDIFGELSQLIAEVLEELPKDIRKLMEKAETNRFDNVDAITPAMRIALEQILHCPFAGRTKQIYLESKCLELISLKLAQIKEREKPSQNWRSLKPDDIDRIHLAKTILIANPENPPSLIELARQVSLNDYKLKLGFRQVFGTTVFGYLHRYRMETARQLLSERRMNVKEVAQAVGYANQSRFAAAFRKQYGINPKSFLLGKKSV